MLKGMRWRRVTGVPAQLNWYTPGGYFWRCGNVVWWVVPIEPRRRYAEEG